MNVILEQIWKYVQSLANRIDWAGVWSDPETATLGLRFLAIIQRHLRKE